METCVSAHSRIHTSNTRTSSIVQAGHRPAREQQHQAQTRPGKRRSRSTPGAWVLPRTG